MSACSFLNSASASAFGVFGVVFVGQLVQHRQIVESLAQLFDAPQLALGVRQLAGHPLRAGLVVPQIGIGSLVLELLDPAAQTVDVQHPLHRGQGGVECRDVSLSVGVHGHHVTGLASTDPRYWPRAGWADV